MSFKEYLVILTCCDQVTVVVEAESKEEAKDIAETQAKGNVFGDSFEVDSIEQIK